VALARIRVLPPEVARKIAAGEVIERPASVVKELVENSLDAASHYVWVDLWDGGKRRIVVTDDGEGMEPEDAKLALLRHATSKISAEEDLFAIKTLGFRGEALAAISAVSHLTLTTKTKGGPGTRVLAEGGEIKELFQVGAPQGTRVEVQDLFFNLPARKKFLKGVQTELAHCMEVVLRMALAYPEVGLYLKHNGRPLLRLPPVKDLRVRLGSVMGKEALPFLIEVRGEEEGRVVEGWISKSSFVRGNPKGIYFYVNGRYVRDRLLSHALLEAYRGTIPKGSYPVAVLFLKVPPEEVDVNVHPTKTEIRFRKADLIWRLFEDTLSKALSRPLSEQTPLGPVPPPEVKEEVSGYARGAPAPESGELGFVGPKWRPLGQVLGTYIVAEGNGGVLIVDQHAAHERIIYERLRKREGDQDAQRLLVPLLIELRKDELRLLMEQTEELAASGLHLEPFGEQTLAVKAIPSFLRPHEVKGFLQELAQDLSEGSKGKGEIREKIWALMACKGAVKANTPLSREEMERLLRDLASIPHPYTCPHGRPVFIELDRKELERRFGR